MSRDKKKSERNVKNPSIQKRLIETSEAVDYSFKLDFQSHPLFLEVHTYSRIFKYICTRTFIIITSRPSFPIN